MTDNNDIQALLSRNAENRCTYLLEQAKQTNELWILTDDVGAVMFQSEDEDCIPVWPSKDIAKLWCDGDWQACQPHSITLEAWLEKWTPGLEDDEVNILAFPNTQDEGVVLAPWEFADQLSE